MPFGIDDAAFAAIMSTVASAAGSAGSAVAQGKLNKKNRQWQEKMYQIQRQDYLENWRMQNEYNTPRAQMQRFKEAGLNPNLIYGQGNNGNANDIQLGKPGNPDTSAPDYTPVGRALSDSFSRYQDYRMANAQISNTEKQREILNLQEENLRYKNNRAVIDNAIADIKKSKDEKLLKFVEPMAQWSLEMAAQKYSESKQRMALALNEDDRRTIQTSANLMEAVQNVALKKAMEAHTWADKQRIYASIRQIKADAALKELSYRFQKDGIAPPENTVASILMRLIPPELFSDFQKKSSDYYNDWKNNGDSINSKMKSWFPSWLDKNPFTGEKGDFTDPRIKIYR